MTNFKFSFQYIFLLQFVFLVNNAVSQSKIKLGSNHPDAEFYALQDTNDDNPVKLGVGSIELKLEKNGMNRVLVSKEGYEPVISSFPRTEKWDKEHMILLENRLIHLEVNHEDAKIFVEDGEEFVGHTSLIVPKGQTRKIHVSKRGYLTKSFVFENKPNGIDPPIIQKIHLKDRVVALEVNHSDAIISSDQNIYPNGKGDIIIPDSECVEVLIEREGYVSQKREFCNTPESENLPPFFQKVILEEREMAIQVIPNDANIFINDELEAFGNHVITLPKGKCIMIEIIKEGYISYKNNYCNQGKLEDMPISESISMVVDEAFMVSVESEKANSRVPLTIRKSVSSSDAWKTLISIITKEFDVLETVDFNAGYLISAWQYEEFNKGERTIRSRVIITNADSNEESNYAIKLISQYVDGNVEVRENANFKDWNRILKKYHELFDEIELRLQ